MKTFKKLLLVSAMSTVLAACGGSEQASSSSTAQPAQAEAQKASAPANNVPVAADNYVSPLPANAPTVNVATVGKTLPFSFSDNAGQLIGMDVDVIRKIGEEAGFKVQFHKKPWVNMLDSVETGESDLAISGISYTDEREKKYAISNSYAFNPSSLMFIREDLNGKVKDLSSLEGLTVGVLGESKQDSQITAANKAKSIVRYNSTYLLFTGMLKKEVDVIAQDSLLLNQLAKTNTEYKTFSVNYENESEPSARLVILVNKDKVQLRDDINKALAKIKEDGTLAKIEEKWLK
ncbi:substrate-binding periplasmic protein [Kingella negevensis]|uniref:substrate-binding periplasmic protein n=1 Tax=Kingella negevensis TaxID=1522312 RepID=UPI00050A3397|nr:transporter substrate-binding domain-containing protein [Kingella negevensis]WII90827.1 transporter substrate-binding domain-containing protein [Kingella negevensis]